MGVQRTFWSELASKIRSSVLLLVDPILYILRVTVVYLAFVVLDWIVIRVVSWSFADAISHFPIAETFLEYIQLLSALGIAVIYVLHFAFNLFYEARHIIQEGNLRAGNYAGEENVNQEGNAGAGNL